VVSRRVLPRPSRPRIVSQERRRAAWVEDGRRHRRGSSATVADEREPEVERGAGRRQPSQPFVATLLQADEPITSSRARLAVVAGETGGAFLRRREGLWTGRGLGARADCSRQSPPAARGSVQEHLDSAPSRCGSPRDLDGGRCPRTLGPSRQRTLRAHSKSIPRHVRARRRSFGRRGTRIARRELRVLASRGGGGTPRIPPARPRCGEQSGGGRPRSRSGEFLAAVRTASSVARERAAVPG